MRLIPSRRMFACSCACLFLLGTLPNIARADDDDDDDRGHRGRRSCKITTFDFFWSGQIAGFAVNGRFSYDANAIPDNGIVREDDLLFLDVSFFDPQGNLLRTYKNNQDKTRFPTVNVAFDTLSQRLLQDGTWNVDDDDLRFRNGFLMGEGSPDLRGMPGTQRGLAFWSRPRDTAVPHLHVDDWDLDNGDPVGDGEFGFPIGFSSHEDVAFFTRTTQNRIDDGRVGEAYFDPENEVNRLATDFEAVGDRVRIVPAKASLDDVRAFRECRSRARRNR